MPGIESIFLIMNHSQAIDLPGRSGPSEAVEKLLWGISFLGPHSKSENLRVLLSSLSVGLTASNEIIQQLQKIFPGLQTLLCDLRMFSPIFTTNTSLQYHYSHCADWETEPKPRGTCQVYTANRGQFWKSNSTLPDDKTLDSFQYPSQNPKAWMPFKVDIPNYILLFPAK